MGDVGGERFKVEIVGIYPVEADEPCYLVECIVQGPKASRLIGSFTQELSGQPRANWQVPYDEHFLDSEGTSALNPAGPAHPPTESTARVAFFFHHLDLKRPLLTPAGVLNLPPPTPRPARLRFLSYEPPC